jgi:ferredoxin
MRENSPVKVSVDRGRCDSHGICRSLDPKRFAVDGEGNLVVRDENVSEEHLAGVEEAVAACPSGALHIQWDLP